MKRRSFIAAAVGLIGEFLTGPKVFGAPKHAERLPLPPWLPTGYKFSKMITIHDQEWELFQLPVMAKFPLMDTNKSWAPIEEIKFFYQVIRKGNIIRWYFTNVAPGQVVECYRWENLGLNVYGIKVQKKMVTMGGRTCWPLEIL